MAGMTEVKKFARLLAHKKLILLASFGLLLIVALAVQLAIYEDIYRRLDAQEQQGTTIKTLVVESVRNAQRETVTDPVSGKVYIPDARLVLSGSADAPRLSYSGDKTELNIAQDAVVDQAVAGVYSGQSLNDTFNHVPCLQACSRQIVLRFQAPDKNNAVRSDHMKQVFTKQLADKRTVYAYQDTGCASSADTLITYLQTIQSY